MDKTEMTTSFFCFTFCCLLLIAAVHSTSNDKFQPPRKAPQAKIGIDTENHMFMDEFGRIRIFHGVNCVNKEYPWYPEYMLNETRLDDLEKSGMNVVRLGTMWSGVEPIEGVYNDTYIDILRNIVIRLAERGIYTLLDMHQDVLTYIYDGVPRWLVESFPEPTNPYPWPLEWPLDAWALGYLSQACSEGFQYLYNDTSGALEKWAQFWVVVAQRLGRDQPAVLGYDWINEPWVGDFFQQPSLITPGEAGRQNLLPVYDYINSVVRQYDTQTIQFYEPVPTGVAFDNDFDYLGSGFNRVPGGWYYEDVSAYSYHMYCWYLEVLGSGGTDEERQEAVDKCTYNLLPRMFEAQDTDVKNVGGTSMLTEFGLCRTEGEDQILNIDCSVFLDLADKWLQSWMDWDYQGKWYREGQINVGRQKDYSRPYARATAGTPIDMMFNKTTRHFHLTYKPNRSIPTDLAPTEIYISTSFQYISGYLVYTSPPELQWDVVGDLMYVRHNGFDDSNFPDMISIDVLPADSTDV